MAESVREVIILGSGPAGLTAALYAARANLAPLVLHGPQPGGQLTTTTMVENYPGFTEGILGPDLMAVMEKQAVRFGAEVRTAQVTKVDFARAPYRLFVGEEEFRARAVIIATGASAKTLGLARESELMGYGLSTCATCDGAFFRGQVIVVVGGGDSAAEEALFLTKFGSRVLMVHRRDELRASKIMAKRVLEHPKIEMVWDSTIEQLLGDKKAGITGIVIRNTKTNKTSELACGAVFYGIGHTPNTALFKGILEMDENGYLITKPGRTATKIPGIFACGDVQDHYYRQAVTAAGSGCMGAIEAERYLSEHGG